MDLQTAVLERNTHVEESDQTVDERMTRHRLSRNQFYMLAIQRWICDIATRGSAVHEHLNRHEEFLVRRYSNVRDTNRYYDSNGCVYLRIHVVSDEKEGCERGRIVFLCPLQGCRRQQDNGNQLPSVGSTLRA
jgi:hypothetical protein